MLTQILTQLGTTAVVIAIAGWFLKTWISHQFENLQAAHAHNLALKLEAARAEWAKDVARLNVHENYLHTRRVALIEEMHKEAVEAEFSLQNFLVSWWAFTNGDELLERGFVPRGHFDDGPATSMEKRGQEFCERYLRINSTLHRNVIFFDEGFTDAVRSAYAPFFDAIVNLEYDQLPPIPEEFKNVVEAGRAPRRAVVALFRTVLGVTEKSLEQGRA
jgi:hypothetical protein